MRLSIVLCLAASTTTAHADGDHFTLYGLGPAIADGEPGMAFHLDKRLDADDDEAVFGARIGLDVWSAGERRGGAVPLGIYFGGQVDNVRSTIGGGVGLFAVSTRPSGEGFGVAPFADATIEYVTKKAVFALEGRLARQAVLQMADYNVYSVMFMFGRRYR